MNQFTKRRVFNDAKDSASSNVLSVNSGTDITVDNTDPSNPIINFTGESQSAILASDIDWDYTHLYKTLAANTTFTFSNAADAKTIIIAITNTASNYTVTWPVGVLWTGGSEPVQTIGAFTDIYTLVQINSVIYGSYVQNLS